MKRQIFMIASVSYFLVTACQNNNKNENNEISNPTTIESKNEMNRRDVSYTMANNYFVKNTVSTLDNPKIETSEKFNEIFGMATTMGKMGKPTEIDFTKQNVIAVILPETDFTTSLNPISLKRNEKEELVLTYQNIIGEKQSFKTRPSFAIIIDKTETGRVILEEKK